MELSSTDIDSSYSTNIVRWFSRPRRLIEWVLFIFVAWTCIGREVNIYCLSMLNAGTERAKSRIVICSTLLIHRIYIRIYTYVYVYIVPTSLFSMLELLLFRKRRGTSKTLAISQWCNPCCHNQCFIQCYIQTNAFQ